MTTATVSSRYLITFPKEIRQKYNLKPGQKVIFVPREKTIELIFPPLSGKMDDRCLCQEDGKRPHEKLEQFEGIAEQLKVEKG